MGVVEQNGQSPLRFKYHGLLTADVEEAASEAAGGRTR